MYNLLARTTDGPNALVGLLLMAGVIIVVILVVALLLIEDAITKKGGFKNWFWGIEKVIPASSSVPIHQSKDLFIWVFTFEAQIKGYVPIFKQRWFKGTRNSVETKVKQIVFALEEKCLSQIEKNNLPKENLRMQFTLENKYQFDRHVKRRRPIYLFENKKVQKESDSCVS